MTTSTHPAAQDKVARTIGLLYLLTMVTALFGPLYVRASLVVAGDAAATATRIADAQTLFRAAILSDVLTSVGCVVLACALHELLRPVSRHMANLALAWRLMEVSILTVAALCGVVVLALLGGAAQLQRVPAPELQALAFTALRVQGSIYNVGLLFFGLGSLLFARLLMRTHHAPRWLSALGVFGSSLVVLGTVLTLLWPTFAKAFGMSTFGPIFVFEVTVGVWLLMKGAGRPPKSTPSNGESSSAPA